MTLHGRNDKYSILFYNYSAESETAILIRLLFFSQVLPFLFATKQL